MKYILIAFVLLGCNNVSEKKEGPKLSTELLDTIKTAPGQLVATPLLFETAFIKGTTQKVEDLTFNLYGITIGKIKISSGRIVACDPLHIDEYGKPFTQVFPNGEFPVQLSIAKFGGDELIAFGRIKFSEEPVVNWQFALLEGQNPIPIDGAKIHGYSVDAGRVIFADDAACKALEKDKLTNKMNEDLHAEMIKHNHGMWKYAMLNVGQHNLAAFTTGTGDGHYATYVGFDAKGQPCRLLTDFGLFNWKKK